MMMKLIYFLNIYCYLFQIIAFSKFMQFLTQIFFLAVQHERGPRNSTLKKRKVVASHSVGNQAISLPANQYSLVLKSDIMASLLKAEPSGVCKGKRGHGIEDILCDNNCENVGDFYFRNPMFLNTI